MNTSHTNDGVILGRVLTFEKNNYLLIILKSTKSLSRYAYK